MPWNRWELQGCRTVQWQTQWTEKQNLTPVGPFCNDLRQERKSVYTFEFFICNRAVVTRSKQKNGLKSLWKEENVPQTSHTRLVTNVNGIPWDFSPPTFIALEPVQGPGEFSLGNSPSSATSRASKPPCFFVALPSELGVLHWISLRVISKNGKNKLMTTIYFLTQHSFILMSFVLNPFPSSSKMVLGQARCVSRALPRRCSCVTITPQRF